MDNDNKIPSQVSQAPEAKLAEAENKITAPVPEAASIGTDNKIAPQVAEVKLVEIRDWLLKCLPQGRPSIQQSPDLQKEYIAIYIERIVQGLTEQEIATSRGISRGKVKNAIKWCREANSNCTSVERLVDAVNALDFRLRELVKDQQRLKQMLEIEYQALANLPSAPTDPWRKIEALNRLILLQEDRILMILHRKFTVEALLGEQLPPIDDAAFVAHEEEQYIRSFVNFMFHRSIPRDELKIIFDIVLKNVEGQKEKQVTVTS